MQLTQAQLEQFDRDGYLFFPNHFSPQETKKLIDEVPHLYAQQRPENVREKGTDAVRTNFAAHLYSEPYARLARHPRMVKPVEQMFGEGVTCTSSRSTAKPPLMATCGNGIRISALGKTTTKCRNRAP